MLNISTSVLNDGHIIVCGEKQTIKWDMVPNNITQPVLDNFHDISYALHFVS